MRCIAQHSMANTTIIYDLPRHSLDRHIMTSDHGKVCSGVISGVGSQRRRVAILVVVGTSSSSRLRPQHVPCCSTGRLPSSLTSCVSSRLADLCPGRLVDTVPDALFAPAVDVVFPRGRVEAAAMYGMLFHNRLKCLTSRSLGVLQPDGSVMCFGAHTKACEGNGQCSSSMTRREICSALRLRYVS